MPRHLTLADIGKGASRRRAPRQFRFGRIMIALVVVLTGAAAAVAPTLLSAPPSRGATTGCPNGSTELVVAGSSETAALMTRFAAGFSVAGKDDQGRCVHVTVLSGSSAEQMNDLATGWTSRRPAPDVWTPSASLWLDRLNDALAGAGHPQAVRTPGSTPRLALSPVVLAMPRPMAVALGWPDRPIGWSDLLGLATDRTGWGKVGQPGWGPLRLGVTAPATSAPALEGVTSLYSAAARGGGDLRPGDPSRTDVISYVSALARVTVTSTPTDGTDPTTAAAQAWARADRAGTALTQLSALVAEEHLVACYNDGNPTGDPAQLGKNPKPSVPLVAVYPKEGTVVADHPYALLDESWVTPAKRQAAAAFLGYLRSADVQRAWQANDYRGGDGTAGPQMTSSLGVLPQQPTRTLATPSAATVTAVLNSWTAAAGTVSSRPDGRPTSR